MRAASKRWRLSLLAALALATAMPAWPQPGPEGSGWREFRQSRLEARRQAEGRRYLGFLEQPAIRAGLYVLPAGGVDNQGPHDHDEVYVVTAGRAVLSVAEHRAPVAAGSIAYVRAGVPHRFVEIEQELHSIVLFSGAQSEPTDPAWAATTLDEVRRFARPDGNEWVGFFDFETLHLGLYMLPEEVGGDSALTHQVDEINVVTKGRAVFRVGEEETRVGPGSLVWVAAGRPHFFHSLQGDLDVLILFHQRPGVTTP